MNPKEPSDAHDFTNKPSIFLNPIGFWALRILLKHNTICLRD
jgi:hypothetical protein